MERNPVSSSNLASVGYQEETETLEVEFLKGGIYQYFGVPSHVYQELISASSVGGYFAQNVRNSYTYSQVG
ncbi:KTSC domain-containing protein [Stenotrophomonas rhizophila]